MAEMSLCSRWRSQCNPSEIRVVAEAFLATRDDALSWVALGCCPAGNIVIEQALFREGRARPQFWKDFMRCHVGQMIMDDALRLDQAMPTHNATQITASCCAPVTQVTSSALLHALVNQAVKRPASRQKLDCQNADAHCGWARYAERLLVLPVSDIVEGDADAELSDGPPPLRDQEEADGDARCLALCLPSRPSPAPRARYPASALVIRWPAPLLCLSVHMPSDGEAALALTAKCEASLRLYATQGPRGWGGGGGLRGTTSGSLLEEPEVLETGHGMRGSTTGGAR